MTDRELAASWTFSSYVNIPSVLLDTGMDDFALVTEGWGYDVNGSGTTPVTPGTSPWHQTYRRSGRRS